MHVRDGRPGLTLVPPPLAGEGDREAVEGASSSSALCLSPPPSRCVSAARHLPRFAREEQKPQAFCHQTVAASPNR
ncbi:hypothetical protein DDF65_03800 [Caulobacter radicis]|uniref:Uncharacterized protein n=1 Tax=Caulobacter radicis TaxID=2172650 RepID=A0A2T9JV64_9CAUL|nr:hypothetical protein DDF65_03800 [Caulobacter radicis]